ncbi:hypothetical protein [Gaiella sp.]|jgi:hypothetical protein|uniref:hypothetical protein n=1 Tax=Gaiella sp. TaxID=2663207 RepID=UPI002E3237F7|nr:hypothetical protein [Gaiella sp.]HEX5582873.1 hypothetical protein [Gaiella sp.]
MRILLTLALVLAAAVLLRRSRGRGARVHVAWRDGAELDLRPGSGDHARLVARAERVLG